MVKSKSGQQEIAGFVLIVVIVVIAMMIFLVISLRKAPEPKKSLEIDNFLFVLMKSTTECAEYEPNYYTVEDLIKSAFLIKKECKNLGISTSSYFNQTIPKIIEDSLKTERTINAYQFYINKQKERIFNIVSGNCTSELKGSSYKISSLDGDLDIRLITC